MNTTSKRLLVVVLAASLLVATLALAACNFSFGGTGKLSVQYDDTHVIYEGDDLETVSVLIVQKSKQKVL